VVCEGGVDPESAQRKQHLATGSAIHRDDRATRYLAPAVIAIGFAHFLVPKVFDPINRLGFPHRARKFTYINGAIEILIGVLLAFPRTRKGSYAVSTCYVVHLIGNIVRTQAGVGNGTGRSDRRFG
jgi:uncharacterized membrane protein